jgi:hypothetical protein
MAAVEEERYICWRIATLVCRNYITNPFSRPNGGRMVTKQLHGEVAFTHDWYRSFLELLLDEGYRFRSFGRQPTPGDVFLRHDVDLSLNDASVIARLEADLGIQSTYCIWLASPLYNALEREHRKSIREIRDLGHEIGLQFDTRACVRTAEPTQSEIEEHVTHERLVLEGIVPELSSAVSFHRPPSWVIGKDFDGFQNTFADPYFSETTYISDSNQRWRDKPPELEDRAKPYQILTHPGLWGDQDAAFDRRIERSVLNSCQTVNRRVREEFVDTNR